MSYRETVAAIGLAARVVDEGRRRLPAGMSGAAIDREWRDAAWRCTVAGMAILDAEAIERIACDRDEAPAAEAEAVAVLKMPTKSAVPIRVRWEGRRHG